MSQSAIHIFHSVFNLLLHSNFTQSSNSMCGQSLPRRKAHLMCKIFVELCKLICILGNDCPGLDWSRLLNSLYVLASDFMTDAKQYVYLSPPSLSHCRSTRTSSSLFWVPHTPWIVLTGGRSSPTHQWLEADTRTWQRKKTPGPNCDGAVTAD